VGDVEETIEALRALSPVELADLMAGWRYRDPEHCFAMKLGTLPALSL
jgi:hypothetical protein